MIKFTFVGLTVVFLIMSVAVADLTDGLVLYMPFEEGQGDVTWDLSPNGFEGKIEKPKWGDGKFGKAIVFDGNGTYVEVPMNEAFNIKSGITMAAWVTANLPFDPVWKVILNAKKSSQGPWGLQTRAAGNLETFYDVQGTRVWTSSISLMEPDEFHFVAGTYDKENGFAVYFDGVREDGGENSGGLATRGELDSPPNEGIVIGHFYNNANRWWDGIIDEVMIYNRALSDEEIAELFKGSLISHAIEPAGKLAINWGDIKRH